MMFAEMIYCNKTAIAIGTAISIAIGPYWAAPLHPSESQSSQNRLFMPQIVLVNAESEHDLTTVGFTTK